MTTLSIESGARIAVVSKSKKGEFWDKVKEGMEAAVKDVNTGLWIQKRGPDHNDF